MHDRVAHLVQDRAMHAGLAYDAAAAQPLASRFELRFDERDDRGGCLIR